MENISEAQAAIYKRATEVSNDLLLVLDEEPEAVQWSATLAIILALYAAGDEKDRKDLVAVLTDFIADLPEVLQEVYPNAAVAN